MLLILRDNMDIENFIFPNLSFTPAFTNINADQAMRDLRDQTLKNDVDSYNPIRYAALTAEQQQELAVYRQALLDLPQQQSWPNNVVWPTKPAWM